MFYGKHTPKSRGRVNMLSQPELTPPPSAHRHVHPWCSGSWTWIKFTPPPQFLEGLALNYTIRFSVLFCFVCFSYQRQVMGPPSLHNCMSQFLQSIHLNPSISFPLPHIIYTL